MYNKETIENYGGTELTKGSRKRVVKTVQRDFTKMKMVRIYEDEKGRPFNVPTYTYIKKEEL